jgi:uncharacterized protein
MIKQVFSSPAQKLEGNIETHLRTGRMKISSSKQQDNFVQGFNIIAKPIGPVCNLDCKYCFYTEKHALFPKVHNYRMSDEVLEAFIQRYIESQPLSTVPFVWQGGEPTLLGVDFFCKAVRLQNKYAQGKQITNSLQTNGTLLDDSWCEFLAKNNFLVGISLDGPQDIHNVYRVDSKGSPTFKAVMHGLEYLKKHQVEFNVLCCVAGHNEKKPLDVYQFFKEQGIQYIQFIPVVERHADNTAAELGLRLAIPSGAGQDVLSVEVTDWSVKPSAYGDFLIEIFNQWVRSDVGSVFIMNFEWALSSWVNGTSCACTFSENCGRCLVMEHNGDVYSCDHYVYPAYHLGNVLNTDLKEMAESENQLRFGRDKQRSLPACCKDCDVLFACHGGCPKHRFGNLSDGESKVSYMCEGYKRFFKHITPYMKKISQFIRRGKPAKMIMDLPEKFEDTPR